MRSTLADDMTAAAIDVRGGLHGFTLLAAIRAAVSNDACTGRMLASFPFAHIFEYFGQLFHRIAPRMYEIRRILLSSSLGETFLWVDMSTACQLLDWRLRFTAPP